MSVLKTKRAEGVQSCNPVIDHEYIDMFMLLNFTKEETGEVEKKLMFYGSVYIITRL